MITIKLKYKTDEESSTRIKEYRRQYSSVFKVYFNRLQEKMPSKEILDAYYNKLLASFPLEMQSIERKYDISFAEAKDYTFTIVKAALIQKLEKEELLD